MSNFKPAFPFSTAMILLTPTITSVSGVDKKTYPTIQEALQDSNNIFYCSFKTYGGTEHDVNGIYAIEDTASVETWYRPDIKSNCKVARGNDGAIFDIINEPENIDQRNQFMKFKLKRNKGGV